MRLHMSEFDGCELATCSDLLWRRGLCTWLVQYFISILIGFLSPNKPHFGVHMFSNVMEHEVKS